MSETNVLNNKQYQLLLKIIGNKWCFDKRDNTFKVSNRKISDRVKVSPSSVDQLLRVLNKHSLISVVEVSVLDSYGVPGIEERRMLSPIFMWWYHKYERWTAIAWFHLKSFDAVKEWRRLCRELDCYIDPKTGEMIDFNWWYVTDRADRYTSFDRCWRAGEKDANRHGTEEYYRMEDCQTSPLTPYDIEWFRSINNERY